MGKKNLSIDLYRYKDLVFGSVLYCCDEIIQEFADGTIRSKNDVAIDIYYDEDSDIDSKGMSIGVQSNGYIDTCTFSHHFDNEIQAEEWIEEMEQLVAIINAIDFGKDVDKDKTDTIYKAKTS